MAIPQLFNYKTNWVAMRKRSEKEQPTKLNKVRSRVGPLPPASVHLVPCHLETSRLLDIKQVEYNDICKQQYARERFKLI